MKNTTENIKKKIDEFVIMNSSFFWSFEGNGEFSQKHDDVDYRKFIQNNYQSKSNQQF